MSASAAPLPGIKKIAFLRANGLGDFVFALPALEALREAYPQAEIVLLGKKWHQRFLDHRPGPVDRVIPIPPSTGVNEKTYWETSESRHPDNDAFFSHMQKEAFDLAIQAHGGGRNSNPFLIELGARVTAGMKTPDAPELDFWMPYRYWQHEVLRLLELVSLIGAHPVILDPVLQLANSDREEAFEILGEWNEQPMVILHPAATDQRRRWSAEKFAAVGDALADAGLRVIVTGTPPEEDVVNRVIEQMHHQSENLCGKISLSGFAGVMSLANLVIANDSGPLHLAEAVGTATVSVYWCGNLINAGSFTRTRHRQLLSWRLLCPICSANTLEAGCDHSASFVDDVSIDEVLREAFDLLSMQHSVQA
jgi:ADP-heptose:LPS heptosyltransferase